MMRSTLFTMAALVLGLHGAITNADTIYVPDDWPTIQEAIFACQDGDTVVVRDGVWTGPYNKNIDFGGLAVTVRSENGAENCIIDCEGDGHGFQFRFGEGPDSVVAGFTITNGYRGVLCESGSSPRILDCTFTSNSGQLGGGVYCGEAASPTIANCTFTRNSASQGGGLYSYRGNVTIANCTFTYNSAQQGGGIYCYGSSPTITNCIIAGNRALYSSGVGGGIYCHGGSPTITNCIIAGNRVFYSHGEFTGYGGGVYCRSSSVTIRNCAIVGNVADNNSAGGLYCDGGSATITNCTIAGNSAFRYGGGVYCHADATISNSILWGNTAENGPELCVVGYFSVSVQYSDVKGGWAWVYVGSGAELDWGEGNIIADPLFVDPDGPDDNPNTWEDNDYHLGTDSPCIDAGDPYFIPELDERDIDGQMRVWDGDDDGEWIVDMGSDEFGSIIPGDLNGDGCVSHADLNDRA